jgi:signal transduction histidine kinase
MARLAALSLRLTEAFAEVGSLQGIQDAILSNKLTIEEASTQILDLARKLTGSASGQILLLEGQDTLVIKASTSPEEVNVTRVGVSNSVSGIAVETGHLINVPDIRKEPRYRPFLGGKMLSELAVPLRAGDKIIGVVNIESAELATFKKHDEEILSVLAGVAAMAFRTADELDLRKRASEADKMLSAGQIVHRLTGRSGAIRGWIEIIKDEQTELLQSNETFAMAINDIELKAGEILKLVDELKQRAAGQFELLEVPPLIKGALDKFGQTEEFKKFGGKLVIENQIKSALPRIRADATLTEVFLNLLTNSAKAMSEGGQIQILSDVDPGWVNISFADNGPGIPPAYQKVIFDAKFSGSDQPGHGLGLWWSRAYVRTLGGDLFLESERRRGACFTVKLPIPS